MVVIKTLALSRGTKKRLQLPKLRSMTDEQKRRGPAATQISDTGQTVQKNVARLRKQRGWTTYEFAHHMEQQGRPIPQSGISRVESGGRRVDADDLLAFAVALNTSPATLLLPDKSDDTLVRLTAATKVSARTAWRWIRGLSPADDWGTLTDDEWHDDEHDKAAERDYWRKKEAFDAVTLPPDLRRIRQHPASRDADLVGLHVEKLVRLNPQVSDETFEEQLSQTRIAVARLLTELDRMAEERALRSREEGGGK
jgi:transcriptional regulator with XRE-family HTH domain